MFKSARICSLVLIASLATPLSAQTYRAINGMMVEDAGNGTLIVSGDARLWARDYWCAAGEYAHRRLGLDQTVPLYVSGPYQRGSTVVTFSTKADGLTPVRLNSISETVRTKGATMKVGFANGYCRDRFYINRD